MDRAANETPESIERRAFLQNAIATSAAIAGTALLTGCATGSGVVGAQASSGSATSAAMWDMSWQKKLGKYKTVYDGTDPQKGAPLATVALTIAGYKAAYPHTSKDFTPVLVLRHNAAYVALNHAMWKRTRVNLRLKPKEIGEKYADQNPFISFIEGTSPELVTRDSTLDALTKQGTIILVCNRALNVLARGLAASEASAFPTTELALAEIKRNLFPGAYVMPNGVFAVCAAQDAGCGIMPLGE